MSWINSTELLGRDARDSGLRKRPTARNFHTATVLGEHLYVIGGTNGQEFFADVYELDLRSLEWRDLAPAATGGSRSRLTRRSRHTTVAVTDGRARQLIIYGGINPDFRKRDDSSDVFILDLPEGALPRWVKPYSANPGRRPTPRFAHCSAAIDHRMFVFAGHDGKRALNDLAEYDARAHRWRQLTTETDVEELPPSHNYRMVSVPQLQRLVVVGGVSDFGHVWTMDVGGTEFRWQRHAVRGISEAPSPRQEFSVAFVPARFQSERGTLGSLYVVGGGGAGGQLYNDTYVLRLSKGDEMEWSKEPVGGSIPGTRIGHTTSFHGDEASKRIILFGGSDRSTCFDDMFVLDLDAIMFWHAWDASEIGGKAPPSERVGHTCTLVTQPEEVSTRMLVFGGDQQGEVLGDLWELKKVPGAEPARWQWSQPKVSKTPALVSHTATYVPEQRKLYVFGGGNLLTCMRDLWVLHMDRTPWKWENLTDKVRGEERPSARAGHTATLFVYEGRQFIFYIGGYSEREYLADVYRLEVTAGTPMNWAFCLPTSLERLEALRGQMMTPRLGHSATLVGTRIYVWGGVLRGAACDTRLYAFDPVKYTWDAVVAHGEPPCPRYGHSAVGDTMGHPKIFIMGGVGVPDRSAVLMSDLHVFDLNTLTWSKPRVRGEQHVAPRARHTAVPVDGSIVVMGGCAEVDRKIQLVQLHTTPQHDGGAAASSRHFSEALPAYSTTSFRAIDIGKGGGGGGGGGGGSSGSGGRAYRL